MRLLIEEMLPVSTRLRSIIITSLHMYLVFRLLSNHPVSLVLYHNGDQVYFVDLECLEKHSFLTALLENSRNHHGIVCFSVNSHKASPLWAHFLTGYRRPMAGLNGFKVVNFAATTKVIITTSA